MEVARKIKAIWSKRFLFKLNLMSDSKHTVNIYTYAEVY